MNTSVTLKVTGKSSDGKIIFTDDYYMDVYPGENYFSYYNFDDNMANLGTIDVTLVPSEDEWKDTKLVSDKMFTSANVDVRKDDYGYVKVTGEVTPTFDVPSDSKVDAIILFYDKDKKLVGGSFTTLSKLAKDTAQPFELNAGKVDFDSYKIVCQCNQW